MQAMFMAVSDMIAGVIYGNFKDEKIKEEINQVEVPVGYNPFYFNCWLCSGNNKFACKSEMKKKKFIIECSWCGMDNSVTIPVKK